MVTISTDDFAEEEVPMETADMTEEAIETTPTETLGTGEVASPTDVIDEELSSKDPEVDGELVVDTAEEAV